MPLPHPAAGAVVVTDEVDEGIACFKIVTESATYFYDKAGAGFTSILDRDGIDWINFRPEGTPGVPDGQSGWFRGIPNMARGVFGHPGYTGALSTTADPTALPMPVVTVRSSKDGWQVAWEFRPSHARMTVLSAPARYWLLYEGTPGGELGDDDLCGRSDGRVASCRVAWQGDVVNSSGVAPSMEWVYFADGTLERSLVLLHDDDDVTDSYRRMDGMTVFGFGRADRPRLGQPSLLWRVAERVGGRLGLIRRSSGLLSRVPASLIIGFVEARDFESVKAGIDGIYRAATEPGPAERQTWGRQVTRPGRAFAPRARPDTLNSPTTFGSRLHQGNQRMDLDEFRRHGHAFVDWMADYLATIERHPVRASVRPGAIAERLPAAPPTEGERLERIFADFKEILLPGMTHWQHPSFFAYFPANSSPPSVLAEMLTATLGAQCMLWQTSPAATELETRTLDWLRQMIGLSDGFTGVIQDSASSATLCAILTARERATDWQANENGLGACPPLVFYASEEAHSSVEKAIKIAGLGRGSLCLVPTDADFALRPDALDAAVREDRARGRVPAGIVATLGTTGVGAVDPLRPIGAICRAHGLYLHVDAAWAGSALLLDEERWMIDGAEHADSVVFNPHKWLLTNFDCSAHFVRDPDALVRTLRILPPFLYSRETGEVIDYRDWSIPLGRRFRALKLWFVIRSYGVERLKAMLRDHIAWTAELAELIRAEPDFELVTPQKLALLTFRYRPREIEGDAELDLLNEHLLHDLNDDGRVYLTQTRVRGRYVIRFAIGQLYTTRAHVLRAWQVITETARGLPTAQ